MNFASCDLCDAHEGKLGSGELQVMAPVFLHYGRQDKFSGKAVTLKVFEDNTLVRSTLETPGQGQVLVIDGGGSLRCALLGGQLAVLAERNAWAGVIIHGCVRDVEEINQSRIGVRALAACPVKSQKKGEGTANQRIQIAGVVVHPGDMIYADLDGVLVARQALI
jgi:regulator of ribonuclease activity A